MASIAAQLQQALAAPLERPLYYLAGEEEGLLLQAAAQVRTALHSAGAEDETARIDGPVPNMGEVVAAAGALSLFGTPRVVELRLIAPSTMPEKTCAELAELFGEVASAVLVVTALYKDKKTAAGKKAKLLFSAAAKHGFAAVLQKPTRRELAAQCEAWAEQLGARFAPGMALALVNGAGEDSLLLQNEVAKLAAAAGYGTITEAHLLRLANRTVEADVFELANSITGGNHALAQEKLLNLLALRHEPVAVCSALAGSFIDMLRVRMGAERGVPPGGVLRDFGFAGSDWRLQKAAERSRRYSLPALQKAVLALAQLDRQLKSSALTDKSVLLQTTVAQLVSLGSCG